MNMNNYYICLVTMVTFSLAKAPDVYNQTLSWKDVFGGMAESFEV